MPADRESTVSLREHLEALREAEDRRYAEVAIEREKALKIKETADLAALQLARDIQTYKDEKANELREQINSERGAYLTVDTYDARHAELVRRVTDMERAYAEGVGRERGVAVTKAQLVTAVGAMGTVVTVVVLLANTLLR